MMKAITYSSGEADNNLGKTTVSELEFLDTSSIEMNIKRRSRKIREIFLALIA